MRYEAQGWPRSESRTDGMSTTVYATTSCKAHPASPPKPLVMTIARGAATFALLHSSERWNGASYPDIVQMMAMKLIRTATPSGQSVPFWIDQTWLEGKNLGLVSVPVTAAGIITITTKRPTMFRVEPNELNLAIQRVGMLEIQPWMSMTKTVRR